MTLLPSLSCSPVFSPIILSYHSLLSFSPIILSYHSLLSPLVSLTCYKCHHPQCHPPPMLVCLCPVEYCWISSSSSSLMLSPSFFSFINHCAPACVPCVACRCVAQPCVALRSRALRCAVERMHEKHKVRARKGLKRSGCRKLE